MKLYLGVFNIPYRSEFSKKHVTTGEVAGFLENNYGIFEHFAEQKKELIRQLLINDIRKALMSGKAIDNKLFDFACKKISVEFKKMINQRGFDGLAGVPTAVALAGKSKRFKNGMVIVKRTKKGASRPSFIDTATFRDSLTAWVE